MAAGRAMSRLSLFLCVASFFSAKVFAVTAVLGVDLGTEYIKAALVKPGIPLEIVLTKDSRRKETSAVAFKPPQYGPKAGVYPERVYGSDAMALAPRFPGDVYPNLKTILGLPANSPPVKEYVRRHPSLQLQTHKIRNTAAFKSKDAFAPEEEAWMVEELLAMELQSIKKNAEALAGAGTTVRSVVLTIPPFYTIEEKRAIELAADLAGLKILSLISDGLAVGLNYATNRQFPNIDGGGTPEYHMVFDMGAGSTKATIMKMQSRTVRDIGKFNKTVQEVIVLGSGWDRTLGGDALNAVIVDDMIEKFLETSSAKAVSTSANDIRAHGRAVAKLSKEAERLRHVLSANTNTQSSFESLYDDVDFKYRITRADFEAMCATHAERLGVAVQGALDVAGIRVEDLHSVILHGGVTRTPFVQRQLESIFGGGDKLRSNVNADEAAVFGAGFRAAEISPSFRVKEIRVSDCAVYAAGIDYTNDKQRLQHQRLWTATSLLGAPAKELTLPNKDDFDVNFYQLIPSSWDGTPAGIKEVPTKSLSTTNLTASVALLTEKYHCDHDSVQLKMGLRLAAENGEVEVTDAYVACETEAAEKESFVDGVKNMLGFGNKKDQQAPGDTSEGAESADSSTASTTIVPAVASEGDVSSSLPSTASTHASEPVKKARRTVIVPVQYKLKKTGIPELKRADVSALKDRLSAFEASDRARRLREEVLNHLEGFTYKIRDLLQSEEFITVSRDDERSTLEAKNSAASDWLSAEGAEAPSDELKARLEELRDIVLPIQRRIEENSQRPGLIKGLKDALNQTITFVQSVKAQIAESEAWTSSRLASPTGASGPAVSITTAVPSEDGFAGLEDDDAPVLATNKLDMDDVVKERGPVPPIYTEDDLKESEELYKSISAWLSEKEPEQERLPLSADPILSVDDLREKRERLDRAGMDLAMKGVKNFDKKHKKGKDSSKASRAKKSKSSQTPEAPTPRSTGTQKMDENGNMPYQEEVEDATGKPLGEAGAGDSHDQKPRHDEL
ncbi:Hypoxia up-regulated protein 1 [Pleurostoma richardsiae]|uniref:Hypoxia up-regulated protein 1 n=1 Tax=Pleurostoma richardsiae TaxID=41990 RepID=A0AA38VGF8_9PEZI|nr:Hypoxia up-regulated protein 1 [Pleurostoma richardsiae]